MTFDYLLISLLLTGLFIDGFVSLIDRFYDNFHAICVRMNYVRLFMHRLFKRIINLILLANVTVTLLTLLIE